MVAVYLSVLTFIVRSEVHFFFHFFLFVCIILNHDLFPLSTVTIYHIIGPKNRRATIVDYFTYNSTQIHEKIQTNNNKYYPTSSSLLCKFQRITEQWIYDGFPDIILLNSRWCLWRVCFKGEGDRWVDCTEGEGLVIQSITSGHHPGLSCGHGSS